jgi:hypothetical protein
MAMSINDIAKLLFKKLLGVSSTAPSREFFEEPYPGRQAIMSQDVWNQSDQIPSSASGALVNDGDIDGVVQLRKNIALTAVPGTSGAFYSSLLIDAIPFNFGDGSYNYVLKNSLNQQIPFGLGDWIVDTASGVVTFYGTVPPNMPPNISFYKYVGTKGVGGGTSSIGTKKKIDTAEVLNVPVDYQYFVYGTLEVKGSVVNDGEVAVNTLYVNGGTITNNGTITLI